MKWDRPGRLQHPRSSQYGAAAAGAGTRTLVIGASREEDGFRPIVHRTVMAEAGAVPMGVGAGMAVDKAPYGGWRNYGGGWGNP